MKKNNLLKKYARRVFELDLVWGTSGNISARIDRDNFLITATGKSLREITDRDLIVCDINKDTACPKASMEFRMHREVYRARGDVDAVLHSQPPFSTLIACAKDKDIKLEIIPETLAYLKKIKVIPYYHPGSINLAREAGEGAIKADVLLLKNHGLVTLASSIEEAINKALTFEFLCKLTVLSKAADIKLEPIPRGKVTGFFKLLEIKKTV